MNIEAIRAASARVTAAGQPYEVVPQTIDGVGVPRIQERAGAICASCIGRASCTPTKTSTCIRTSATRSTNRGGKRRALRTGCIGAGVKQGDRVGIAARNYPEWLFAFMGITSIGAVAVTMNAWWSSEELAYGIDDSGLELLFADAERLERVLPLCATRKLRLIAIRADHVAARHAACRRGNSSSTARATRCRNRRSRPIRTRRSSTRPDRRRTRKACWPPIAASFTR